MGQEQRRSIRATVHLLTFLKFLETGKVKRVLTKDISGVGICVSTEEVLTPGDKFGIELQLPGRDETVTFTASVVWSRLVRGLPHGGSSTAAETGLRFVEIDPKAQALLQQYARLNALPFESPPP